MFIQRTFIVNLILLIISNNMHAEFRDPFQPMIKTVQKEITLNAILSVCDEKSAGKKKVYASITYNDENYIVSPGKNIKKTFLVKEIKKNELLLINLETNQEKTIFLSN